MDPIQQKQLNRPALGKGLASLLPGGSAALARQMMADVPAAEAPKRDHLPALPVADVTISKDRVQGITMADVEQIVANQYQPRQDFAEAALSDLAESIRAHGIIQPLIVRRGEDGKFHLIAGERRLRAAKLAGLKHVPVVLRTTTDKEKLELALIENIQREDLNCVEIALSYFQLAEDFRLTQEEIAKRVGRDRASVSNHLRLLKLPEGILGDLRKNVLTFGHGRALLSVVDPLKRMEIRNLIVEKHLSVREAERLVAESLIEGKSEKENGTAEPDRAQQDLKEFSERLGRALGTRVKTKGDKYRGAIMIEYFSKEDLDRISLQLLR